MMPASALSVWKTISPVVLIERENNAPAQLLCEATEQRKTSFPPLPHSDLFQVITASSELVLLNFVVPSRIWKPVGMFLLEIALLEKLIKMSELLLHYHFLLKMRTILVTVLNAWKLALTKETMEVNKEVLLPPFPSNGTRMI